MACSSVNFVLTTFQYHIKPLSLQIVLWTAFDFYGALGLFISPRPQQSSSTSWITSHIFAELSHRLYHIKIAVEFATLTYFLHSISLFCLLYFTLSHSHDIFRLHHFVKQLHAPLWRALAVIIFISCAIWLQIDVNVKRMSIPHASTIEHLYIAHTDLYALRFFSVAMQSMNPETFLFPRHTKKIAASSATPELPFNRYISFQCLAILSINTLLWVSARKCVFMCVFMCMRDRCWITSKAELHDKSMSSRGLMLQITDENCPLVHKLFVMPYS